jgi:hypothetical protein
MADIKNAPAIDAWKLYCEAFRRLWPKAEKVSDVVSPAALQEMVDKMLETGGVIYQAMLRTQRSETKVSERKDEACS